MRTKKKNGTKDAKTVKKAVPVDEVHAAMWRRYRAKKKRMQADCSTFAEHEIRCNICGKIIEEGDPGIEYCKTKRGSENFFHRECLRSW